MSWGGYTPWVVLTALCNKSNAKRCCAFADEISPEGVHLSWMRSDYVY